MNLETIDINRIFRDVREIEEYKSLRSAFASLNGQRVTMMTYALTLFGAVLGFLMRSEPPILWEYKSIILLLILGVFALSQVRFSRYACMVAAYIQVYHEKDYLGMGYHTRMRKFAPFSRNVLLYNYAVVYTVMGVVAVGLPPLMFPGPLTLFPRVLFGVVTVTYFVFNALMYGREFPLADYIHEWDRVKKQEETSA